MDTKGDEMSIEIGQKYIGKNGEVVEVEDTFNYKTYEAIWFFAKGKRYVLTKYDFLEQYKPYEEPKHTVMIEKWLCYDNLAESYSIREESNIDRAINDDSPYLSRVKLICSYEVEL